MVVWYQTIKNNYKTLLLSFFSIFLYNKSKNYLLWLFFIVWYQTTVMISINVIIFSNYMFCEVYKSHPWRHGYPPDIRQISGAAMNLNRPYCKTTNQIDDFLAHIQSQERNSFDMLRKSTFCSHFFQHPRTNNLYLFVFVFSLFCSLFRERMESLVSGIYVI